MDGCTTEHKHNSTLQLIGRYVELEVVRVVT